MSSLSAVLSARAALSDLTPLLTDCGRLCGFACCKGDEQTGMLLFPGEEALFAPCAFGRVIPAHFELAGRPAHLFVCNGTCSRKNRLCRSDGRRRVRRIPPRAGRGVQLVIGNAGTLSRTLQGN